jgi:hypothetical protein
LGDPGKVKRMFILNSSFKTRIGSFFSWKSDDLIVVKNCGNAQGAKGITKFESQTLNPSTDTKDTEPRLRGPQ